MSGRFPYFAKGQVTKGFGRGSKKLGCPTANLPPEVVNELPDDFGTGVYYGLARVAGDKVRKMVMSIGWNPYFKNEKKSMEVHIMHKFDEDFYGKELKIAILGYIRPERNFDSMDSLIEAIRNDIKEAEEKLEEERNKVFVNHRFF
ncbi:unnamed protein product [Phyllotreta striolata]|uniref:Riboflavin kinase n=1 Tax=Phyllotreta striolata TaxID=444603 RepID=A0A9N9TWL4_PHYSR|nr:unnamed protein product [Phyllotreta striolata]